MIKEHNTHKPYIRIHHYHLTLCSCMSVCTHPHFTELLESKLYPEIPQYVILMNKGFPYMTT